MRVALLALAALSVVVAVVGFRRVDKEQYVCPMHPEVTSSGPGECPVCRMALERAHGGMQGVVGGRSGASSTPDGGPASDVRSLERTDEIWIVRRRTFSNPIVAPAWVERADLLKAHLYKDEVAVLESKPAASFTSGSGKGDPVEVRWSSSSSQSWDDSTVEVELRLEASSLRAGDVGRLQLEGRPREVLVVPSTAVMQSSSGPYVLVASPDGQHFDQRRIQVGREMNGLSFVLSGLLERERIALKSAFFLDVDRRLHASTERSHP
jgi:multidrug efflux pump subunit AcrA (membrane-fusion protein)